MSNEGIKTSVITDDGVADATIYPSGLTILADGTELDGGPAMYIDAMTNEAYAKRAAARAEWDAEQERRMDRGYSAGLYVTDPAAQLAALGGPQGAAVERNRPRRAELAARLI